MLYSLYSENELYFKVALQQVYFKWLKVKVNTPVCYSPDC